LREVLRGGSALVCPFTPSRNAMKVILQNKKTGEYFKGPSVWTNSKSEAFVFRDSAAAREFYMKHYIPDVEIVDHAPDKTKAP
jgi:hypothetical protein